MASLLSKHCPDHIHLFSKNKTQFLQTFHLSIFRNNVSFKTVSGESKAVTPEIVAGWNETTLPALLSNYGLENIYDANEFGLFYHCLPEKCYHLKTQKCSGGKHRKIRITGLTAANAIGNKLSMLVISKAKNPRCFKSIKKLPSVDIDHKERAGCIVFYLTIGREM